MIVYGALIVSILITLGFYYFNKSKILWWEFFIPIIVTLLVIIGVKLLIDKANVTFTEYWGETIVSITEEEPYNYWDVETCSYTTCTGSGSNQTCTTYYYDCSHQDDVGPKWFAKTNLNNIISLSEKEHDAIKKQFGTQSSIIGSRKNYDPGDKCTGSRGTKFEGKRVGDVSYNYITFWNNTDFTRKGVFTKHSYENRIKATDLSLFNISVITDEEADSLGLYKYPDVDNELTYPTILGKNIPENIQEQFRKLNAKYGISNKLRLWILVFDNKPISIATQQENYWVKGNKNELVVCIGRKGNEIIWSYSFSWSLSNELTAEVKQKVMGLYESTIIKKDGKSLIIPVNYTILSKDINKVGIDSNMLMIIAPNIKSKDVIDVKLSNTPILNEGTWKEFYNYLNSNLHKFKKRSFDEFDYLTVEPKTWQIIMIYIIAIGLTIGINIWTTKNEFDDKNPKGNNSYIDKYGYYRY